MKLALVWFSVLVFAALIPVSAGSVAAKSFDVRVGQTKRVKGTDVRVRLVSVDEDSRCPQGVDCVWAGNVRVKLVLSRPNRRPLTAALNTNREPQVVRYRGRMFKIEKVAPPRIQGREIKPRDYVITLSTSP